MEKHYQMMLKGTEELVIRSLTTQILDRESPLYGAFPEVSGIVQARVSVYKTEPMIVCFINPESRYFGSDLLYERIMLGLKYVQSVQHENGLFDYITCNFSSAPDTGFIIEKIIPVYTYLKNLDEKSGLDERQRAIFTELGTIIRKGAEGMLEGGFHTPNHRWDIASMLMNCYCLFGDERMKEAAFVYLNEGIDCNEDGEFSEKSAGNYNRVNNDAMIRLSEALQDDSYEQYAVRNLKMMLTYWEPDWSVFTANSTRFDKDRICYPEEYYLEYLKMGVKYNIPEFLDMANRAFDIVEKKNLAAPEFLIWLMLRPDLRKVEHEGLYEVPDFNRFYKDSGIARVKSGLYTYTVMKGKSNFFYLHNGTMKLEMKVCGSFCEHRAFKAEEMEELPGGGYHLSQVMHGWYYLPFEEKPETSDWWKMDNKSRKKKLGPDMHIDVYVTEAENGVDVRVKTSGVEGAPWRIELAFTGVNFLESDGVAMPLSGSEVVVIKNGVASVGNGHDSLEVGPCFGEHHFTEGKEDSEAKTAGAATLYLTDYTGFDHVIELRNVRSRVMGSIR
ncbi:MAG: hypothetical protein J6113_04275 [Lachnospiraceae bacterium]|nr:hypothetical protein [Lachnospiraceae bacterium]